jgi:hypothetical protein
LPHGERRTILGNAQPLILTPTPEKIISRLHSHKLIQIAESAPKIGLFRFCDILAIISAFIVINSLKISLPHSRITIPILVGPRLEGRKYENCMVAGWRAGGFGSGDRFADGCV